MWISKSGLVLKETPDDDSIRDVKAGKRYTEASQQSGVQGAHKMVRTDAFHFVLSAKFLHMPIH
jgi:hypothetical protein